MIKKNLYIKKIPSYRHRKDIQILDTVSRKKIFLKKKTSKHPTLIKRLKYFYTNIFLTTNLLLPRLGSFIIRKPLYIYKPYKLFFVSEDIYGNTYVLPGVSNLHPGKVFISFSFFNEFLKVFSLKGNVVLLKFIPFNVFFSNLSNFTNTKISFAKSSGVFCKVRKLTKKKKKLILVSLPSKREKYFPYNSITYLGKNTDFRVNSLVEGKYGNSFYQKKKINVRGVAMNPVDHPNGGRTKTVKPEKSP
jgi:hypothetical protein